MRTTGVYSSPWECLFPWQHLAGKKKNTPKTQEGDSEGKAEVPSWQVKLDKQVHLWKPLLKQMGRKDQGGVKTGG